MRVASARKLAGVTLFAGAFQFAFFMILSEIYYPDYNVSTNYISDLGATCRATCQVFQPSSTIFNVSVSLLGVLLLATTYFLQRTFRRRLVSVLLATTGIGAMGVGIFPETAGVLHPIFSLIAFLFGGLTAVSSYKLQKPPMSYFAVISGLITVAALLLYSQSIYLGLGNGGMERVVLYPVLLWAIAFGGYLMAPETGS